MKSLNVQVPEELHKKIKVNATLQSTSIRDYVIEAIAEKITRDARKVPNEKQQTAPAA